MRTLNRILLTMATTLSMMSTVEAHDSFSFGINIGGFGYAPPPVVYYPPPVTTYYYGSPHPHVYYAPPPMVTYRYYNGSPHHWNRGGDRGRHHQWQHHGHRGRGDGDRGGWRR